MFATGTVLTVKTKAFLLYLEFYTFLTMAPDGGKRLILY
jgi:hypothetical protein